MSLPWNAHLTKKSAELSALEQLDKDPASLSLFLFETSVIDPEK